MERIFQSICFRASIVPFKMNQLWLMSEFFLLFFFTCHFIFFYIFISIFKNQILNKRFLYDFMLIYDMEISVEMTVVIFETMTVYIQWNFIIPVLGNNLSLVITYNNVLSHLVRYHNGWYCIYRTLDISYWILQTF